MEGPKGLPGENLPVHRIETLGNTDCLGRRTGHTLNFFRSRDILFFLHFHLVLLVAQDRSTEYWMAPVTGADVPLGPTRRAFCVGLVVVSVPGGSWPRPCPKTV